MESAWRRGKMKLKQPTLIQNYRPLRPFPEQELEGGKDDCLAEGEGAIFMLCKSKVEQNARHPQSQEV